MPIKQDVTMIDKYTLVHFLFGYAAKKYGLSYEQIMWIITIYELAEDAILRIFNLRRIGWEKESKHNVLMDITVALLGAKLGNDT